MPRRVADYPDAFSDWNFISSLGAYVFAAGMVVFFANMFLAFVRRRRQSLGSGRDHARMDFAVAAAVPSVRYVAAGYGPEPRRRNSGKSRHPKC
jgi:heme/copper-type cytochrome/quinol oxidase subunit 1